MTFRDTFGAALAAAHGVPDVGPSIDAHLAREDACEAVADKRERALAEMVNTLLDTDSVLVCMRSGRPVYLTSDDLVESISGAALLYALWGESPDPLSAVRDLVRDTARKMCENHVAAYLAHRSQP